MTPALHALGLAGAALPIQPKPRFPALPADYVRRMYALSALTQMAESTAQALDAATPQLRDLALSKRTGALHHRADELLAVVFGSFDAPAADALNALTRCCEAAVGALVAVAMRPDGDEARAVRVHELLTELAELAGIDAP